MTKKPTTDPADPPEDIEDDDPPTDPKDPAAVKQLDRIESGIGELRDEIKGKKPAPKTDPPKPADPEPEPGPVAVPKSAIDELNEWFDS